MNKQETPSLKLTANAPENRPGPNRKPDRIPTIHFQVQTCCGAKFPYLSGGGGGVRHVSLNTHAVADGLAVQSYFLAIDTLIATSADFIG